MMPKQSLKLVARAAVVALVGLSAAGCASGYSNIQALEGGSYLVTKDQAGFMRQHGELWQCKPASDPSKLQCKKVATD
jgi:hypothetical protein